MQVMSPKTKKFLEEMVALAGGNTVLVQQAIREAATSGNSIDMNKVKQYIEAKMRKPKAA